MLAEIGGMLLNQMSSRDVQGRGLGQGTANLLQGITRENTVTGIANSGIATTL